MDTSSSAYTFDAGDIGGTNPPESISDDWNAPTDPSAGDRENHPDSSVLRHDQKPEALPHADQVSPDPTFKLKHLGREFVVSRDEVISLAQKGVDYDRIRARADALSSARRDHELEEFVAEYGSVKPEAIPPEVWNDVADGKPLLSAYRAFENKTLKMLIDAGLKNDENSARSTGSRASSGPAPDRSELELDWYRD